MRVPSSNVTPRGLIIRAALALMIVAALFIPGCTAMRQQLAERRANCNALCQQARTARDEGCPDQADLLLNEAVRQRPDDLETRRQLAEAMWDCGRQHDAIDEYRELTQSHSYDSRLHRRLAVMLWTVGQTDDAAVAAERALRLDPGSADALLVRARSQAARRNFDDAVNTYIKLSKAAPEMLEARLELAEVHIARGNSQQACVLLREIAAQPNLTPDQKADIEWKLGLAYASADRWVDASQHMTNALDVRPASSADFQLLMTARMLAGQDPTGLPAKAVQASSRQPDLDTSAWAALRDRLLVRSTMTVRAGGMANNEVIRADFSKSSTRIQ